MPAPPPPDDRTPKLRRPNRRATLDGEQARVQRDHGGARWTKRQAAAVARASRKRWAA